MTDLMDLRTRPINSLIQDAKIIYENMMIFEKQYYGLISAAEFSHNISNIHGSLLKLAIVLEEKGVEEKFAKMIVNLYTPDEKNALRDFEKFSKLDPIITPPEILADIIVSETGEIYRLIKEAIFKSYIDFANLIKIWEKEHKIRDAISKALQMRYNDRFLNVINAIKLLLDNQPAWLNRIFKEYEDALLVSSEVRKNFEQAYRRFFQKEIEDIKIKMDDLEMERINLFQSLEELINSSENGDLEKKTLIDELYILKIKCDKFNERHNNLLKNWDEKIQELSLLKQKIDIKKRELQGLVKGEKSGSVSREALEAEVFRLRSLISDYDNKEKDYQLLKNKLKIELDNLNDKVSFFERALKGVRKGHFISSEDACMLERIFVKKFESKMRDLPKVLPTPWNSEKVYGWGKEGHIQMFEEFSNEKPIPLNRKSIFSVMKRSFLGFGEEKQLIIEAVFQSHTDTLKKRGFDDWPLTLGEFLKILQKEESLSDSEGRRFHVIGVSSPTGWDRRVIDYIAGEKFSKTYVLRDFLIILIDQITGDVYYSKAHPLSHWYSQLFRPEVNFEEEARIRDWIISFYEEAVARTPAYPHVLISEVIQALKSDFETGLRVLNRLESGGCGELERGTGGETVFHYQKNPKDWRLDLEEGGLGRAH